MAKRRELTADEKSAEGIWLRNLLKSNNVKQKDIADEMGVDNPANIAHWCSGGSAIPDLDLLWIGKKFEQDVFTLRPRLLDYAEYFEGDSILSGLSSDERKTVTDMIELIRRRKPKDQSFFFERGPKNNKRRSAWRDYWLLDWLLRFPAHPPQTAF